MISVVLSQLPPPNTILAGAILGDSHAQAIIAKASALGVSATSVLLDFEGAEAVTASYLKALFKAFAPAPEGQGMQLYPLVTSLGSPDLRYELEAYLTARDLAAQEVSAISGEIKPAAVFGEMDASARETYEQLQSVGPSTAAVLHELNPKTALGQTTWNNRLMKLFEMRLAHRTRAGRHWLYQPAFNL